VVDEVGCMLLHQAVQVDLLGTMAFEGEQGAIRYLLLLPAIGLHDGLPVT
jgi:hypothetical protein